MQNQKGIFIRYYNVNVPASSNSSNTQSTVDIYSDYIYDVYEYTPVWEIDEITDTAEDNPEKMGFAFAGVTGITTHSIRNPRVHDIVSFSYAPYTSDHAYRVKGISTLLNVRDSGMYVFKLELENAFNVSNLARLNIADSYVYSMYDNSNMSRSKYEGIMQEHNIIVNALSNLLFDPNLELYYYIDGNGDKISPLLANNSLYSSLSMSNIRQYFGLEVSGKVPVPWGIMKYPTIAPDSYLNHTTGAVITGDGVISQSTVSSILSYTLGSSNIHIQDCAKLLTLFQG